MTARTVRRAFIGARTHQRVRACWEGESPMKYRPPDHALAAFALGLLAFLVNPGVPEAANDEHCYDALLSCYTKCEKLKPGFSQFLCVTVCDTKLDDCVKEAAGGGTKFDPGSPPPSTPRPPVTVPGGVLDPGTPSRPRPPLAQPGGTLQQ